MVLLGLVLILLSFQYLKIYTKHGQAITVPPLKGLSLSEVDGILKNKKLQYIVIDSSFNADLEPRAVIDQNPKEGMKVKEKRKIYLTLNASQPPMVQVPHLKDNSRRQAKLILESWGLKLGEEIYEPNEFLDIVLGIKVAGHKVIGDTTIPKGSTIDLILGDGFGGKQIDVPDLIGLSLGEAMGALQLSNLSVGNVDADETVIDSINAYVYYQEPAFDGFSTLRMGEAVNLFITQNPPEF